MTTPSLHASKPTTAEGKGDCGSLYVTGKIGQSLKHKEIPSFRYKTRTSDHEWNMEHLPRHLRFNGTKHPYEQPYIRNEINLINNKNLYLEA